MQVFCPYRRSYLIWSPVICSIYNIYLVPVMACRDLNILHWARCLYHDAMYLYLSLRYRGLTKSVTKAGGSGFVHSSARAVSVTLVTSARIVEVRNASLHKHHIPAESYILKKYKQAPPPPPLRDTTGYALRSVVRTRQLVVTAAGSVCVVCSVL